jgi:hypothetical protein
MEPGSGRLLNRIIITWPHILADLPRTLTDAFVPPEPCQLTALCSSAQSECARAPRRCQKPAESEHRSTKHDASALAEYSVTQTNKQTNPMFAHATSWSWVSRPDRSTPCPTVLSDAKHAAVCAPHKTCGVNNHRPNTSTLPTTLMSCWYQMLKSTHT